MKRIVLNSIPIVASLCPMATACPLCRDATAVDNAGGSPPVALFNASVLCILGAFLLIVGIVSFKIIGAIRLVNRQHPV